MVTKRSFIRKGNYCSLFLSTLASLLVDTFPYVDNYLAAVVSATYTWIISDGTSCIKVCFSDPAEKLFLFGPGAGATAVEDTDPTRLDCDSLWSDSRLLQHFVQSSFFYCSRGDLLLVSQILKFPLKKKLKKR